MIAPGAIAAAIAEMEENREIHAQWRDHFAACPWAPEGLCTDCRALADAVGDATTHERHIEKYGRWIALLRELG